MRKRNCFKQRHKLEGSSTKSLSRARGKRGLAKVGGTVADKCKCTRCGNGYSTTGPYC